jgi:hypothetical protein
VVVLIVVMLMEVEGLLVVLWTVVEVGWMQVVVGTLVAVMVPVVLAAGRLAQGMIEVDRQY